MSQATFSIRMEPTLKNEFSEICREIGMSMSTAINVFANAVVIKRKIPFEIEAPSTSQLKYKDVLLSVRSQVEKSKTKKLSLEEINAIIKETRNDRKK